MIGRTYLVTKKGIEVTAYLDSALYHNGLGGGNEVIQSATRLVPYGILPNRYTNPFALVFDSVEKTAEIKPGVMVIYGRQIELTQQTLVYDFHSTSESVQIYCTVFMNLNLEDFTNETASILIVMNGAGYKDFKQDMLQDNVYKKRHGVYQAPIARFIYTPATGEFSDYTLTLPVLQEGTRRTANYLSLESKLNGVKLGTLGEITNLSSLIEGKTYKSFRWGLASNVDALADYNLRAARENLWGKKQAHYSLAKEAEAFGTAGHSVAIDQYLTGIVTAVRDEPYTPNDRFGTQDKIEINVNYDPNKIKKVLVYFDGCPCKADVVEQQKYIFTGWSWADTNRKNGVAVSQYPNINNKFEYSKLEDVDLMFYFAEYHAVDTETGATVQVSDLIIGTTEEYNQLNAVENGHRIASGGQVQSWRIKRKCCRIRFKHNLVPVYDYEHPHYDNWDTYHQYPWYSIIGYADGEGWILSIEGEGNSPEVYEWYGIMPVGWWRWLPLQNVKNEAGTKLIIEFVYEGDVYHKT